MTFLIFIGLLLLILAALILAAAFTVLCCVLLAGIKALPPRNPFSNSNGGRSESKHAWRNNRNACRRFSVSVQRGGLIRLGRASM